MNTTGFAGISMRKMGLIGMLLVVLVGSFFATLWLADSGVRDERSAAEQLANSSIFNRSDLIEAAVAAGLHRSTQMKGVVDAMTRVNDREVRINGWLADPDGDATAAAVLVFVDGKNVATTQTRGERPDVTKALGLAFGTERNVGFEVTFRCRTGQQPMIVGVGSAKEYHSLASARCP
jgi:hypothetical protein